MSSSFVFGCLLAFYFYVGRWTFARLDGDFVAVPVIEQPRFWLVAGLAVIAVMIQSSAPRNAKQFWLTPVDNSIFSFLSYMLLTAIWGSDPALAAGKALELALMGAVALMIAISRSRWHDDQVQLGFWSCIVVVGTALGTFAILQGDDTRAYAPGGGPNTFGRNMGLTAFGALFLAWRFGLSARIGSIGLFAMMTLLVMRSGSRGGLLSFSVATAICAATAKTTMLNKVFVIGLMGLATTIGLLYTDAGQQAADVFHGRILEQTVQQGHLAGRDDLWYQAMALWRERPIFGWGLNGFQANSWNYPHNIVLEVIVEGGVIGLLLLLNVARAWWRQLRQLNVRVSRPRLAALALTIIAAQTSGDLFDSRGMFLMLALSLPLTAVSSKRPILRRPVPSKLHRRAAAKPTARPLTAMERHSSSA